MYKVLIVDDERPALRFLQMIVERYTQDFTIVQSCLCGEDALDWLTHHPVDLLITDISMLDMDGIKLANKARALQSGIHIVIVTGYADFTYAQGAIQAAVDDYLLKPVNVTHMTTVLNKIRDKLDAESAAREPAMLTAMFSGHPYDQQLAAHLYGSGRFYFALIRWGNLGFSSGELHATYPIPLKDVPFHALYGRDEDEQVLFMSSDEPVETFSAAVRAYAAKRKKAATQTIILTRSDNRFSALPGFFQRASALMEQTVVIGQHQLIMLSSGTVNRDTSRQLPNALLKRMEYFILEHDMSMIKDMFISLAADWERVQLPQCCAATMVMQLTYMILALRPDAAEKQDTLLRDVNDLLRYATSYGDLMASLYATLFDGAMTRDKKLSTEELCGYAIQYIQEKYAQPISIQNVSSELGISQTYLSRLLRKHANTSFNTYLTQYRMQRAQALIRDHRETSLRDVAACVGYDDYAYFSKVFRQTVGCSPSQWAGEARKKADESDA